MSIRAPQYAPAALLMLVWPTLALSAEASTLNMANTAWMLTATELSTAPILQSSNPNRARDFRSLAPIQTCSAFSDAAREREQLRQKAEKENPLPAIA